MSLNLKPGNIYLRNLKPKCQIDSDIHRKNSRIFFVDLSYYLCCIWFQVPGYRFGKEKLVNQNQTKNFYCIFQNIYVVVHIRNQSLYIRTAIISVIIYNDCYFWFLYIMANFFQSVYIMTEILVCLWNPG